MGDDGLSNFRRPGRYSPPLNATTTQLLGTGSLGLVRLPDRPNLSLGHRVGNSEMTLMRRGGEDAAQLARVQIF